jgi:MtrB/PioB family decaheme-associated outer membrane protein
MQMMTSYAKLALLIGMFAWAQGAYAQAVDTSEWACEFCPFQQGQDADYTVGASNVSDDSAYFGNATGYDEEGAYANLDGQGSYASESYRLRWTVEDLALDSRFAEIEGGKPGKFDFNLAWRELPRRQFNTTSTIFQESSGDTLSLPAGWVPAPVTSGFTALDASLVNRPIESDRRVFDIGGRYLASSRWSVSADYQRQEHDGLKVYGGSTFTNSSLLPMPFDYVTDSVDIAARYGGARGFVSVGWYLSDFESSNAALRWQQPFSFSAPLGTDTLQQAQAPDNQFQQLSIAAAYSFPTYQTVINASAALGRIDQDTAFLPYTTNANISAGPLPRASLGGDVETTNIAVAITSRPFTKARVNLSYRLDKRDNKTAQDLWERVITDNILSGDPELNIPYSFERGTLSLSADYDLFDSLRVSGGYDRRDIKRDFQEVADQTEDTGWGRLRWTPAPTVEIDARGGASKRDVDSYNEDFAAELGQNPAMRKYNLAYRYRQFGDLRMTWSPNAAPVSISVSGLIADDDYSQSQIGITAGEEFSVAADFSWSVSDKTSLYINTGLESMKSEQAGSEQFGAPDWRAYNDDEFTTIGAGFRVREISDKINLLLDYTRSDGKSKIALDSASGPDPFPDLNSELDYLRFRLTYLRSEKLEIDLNLRYQRFKAEDWSLAGVQPDTIPVVLSLGASPYDDEATIVGIGFRYSLGDTSPAGN